MIQCVNKAAKVLVVSTLFVVIAANSLAQVNVSETTVTEGKVTDTIATTSSNISEPGGSEASADETEDDTPLAQQVEDLKQAALNLNRDLLLLEEELLFPGNTQVAVFVSMDVGEFFQLDSVKVNIDDKTVGSHLYTKKQTSALYRGGVQRLYVGNVKSGEHEISAFFTGKGPAGRDYKRAAKLTFEKTSEPALLELRIVDSTQKLQPVFDIREWELP